jgi:hypothetical protein
MFSRTLVVVAAAALVAGTSAQDTDSGTITVGGQAQYYKDSSCATANGAPVIASGLCSEAVTVPVGTFYQAVWTTQDKHTWGAAGEDQASCVESMVQAVTNKAPLDNNCIDAGDGQNWFKITGDDPCEGGRAITNSTIADVLRQPQPGKPVRITFGNQAEFFTDAACTQPAPGETGAKSFPGFCTDDSIIPSTYTAVLCLDDGQDGQFAAFGGSSPEDCLMKPATGSDITTGTAGSCVSINGGVNGQALWVKATCNVKGC